MPERPLGSLTALFPGSWDWLSLCSEEGVLSFPRPVCQLSSRDGVSSTLVSSSILHSPLLLLSNFVLLLTASFGNFHLSSKDVTVCVGVCVFTRARDSVFN